MKKAFLFILIGLMSYFLYANELIVIETDFFDAPTGEISIIEVTINIPEGFYAAHNEDYFGIDVEDYDGVKAGRTIYPLDEAIETDFGFSKYTGTITLYKEILIDRNARQGEREIELVVYYQLCLEDGTCLIPEEESFFLNIFVVQGQNTQSDRMPDFSGQANNVLKFLLLAFIGGIILNLMPCVLPILSIRAFNLVKQSEDSQRNIFINSVLYTAGIMFSFAVLATVITVIKLSGELVGWGFQFQNPGFVVFLLSLMFVFSLSLFDVFTIQVPGLNVATKASSKSGYWGSFLMGVFCVLLATPCTAPFLGAALGFAFTQPPVIIYAIFLLVGLGLGFPFLLIGVFPRAIKILPKPGEWMNVFKEILGFLLLAFAIKMVQVIFVQMGGIFTINVMYYMLILAFAVWLYGRFVTPLQSKMTQWIVAVAVILLIVFGAIFTLKGHSATDNLTEFQYDGFWYKFSEEAVDDAISQGLPVFIDFTADWCMVCKANEVAVLNQNDIRQAFVEKNVLMLKGDYTRRDPVIHDWLQRYNRAGVPLYLLFLPGEDRPIQFPEVLTKSMVFNALEGI